MRAGGFSGQPERHQGPRVKMGLENSERCFGKDGVVLGQTQKNFSAKEFLGKPRAVRSKEKFSMTVPRFCYGAPL